MTNETEEKDNNTSGEILNRFKVTTSIEQMAIIEGAVDALLNNLDAVYSDFKAVAKSRDQAKHRADGQLLILEKALKEYPEPVTEPVWDKLFRANVAARLDAKRADGTTRYNGSASRDVMVNMIKVATMGLTLAKEDKAFHPSWQARSNLKKYADEIRPMLQGAIDPATGEPRLRSIVTPKKEKKLPKGSLYLLIGCEEVDKGIKGANTVIGASNDLNQLKRTARKLSGKFADFLYVPAPPLESLDWEEDDLGRTELPIQNSAVFSRTVSSQVAAEEN